MHNQKINASAKEICYIAVCVAIMAVCSVITIPLPGGVPVTLQTFAVFLCVGLLGTMRATVAVTVYILLGMIGVPIFSGFGSGVGVILGPTGRYIIGFIFSSIISGSLIKVFGEKPYAVFLAMIIGLLVCYFTGTLWFVGVKSTFTWQGIVYAFTACVLPFIIPDLAKIALAILISNRMKKYINRNSD